MSGYRIIPPYTLAQMFRQEQPDNNGNKIQAASKKRSSTTTTTGTGTGIGTNTKKSATTSSTKPKKSKLPNSKVKKPLPTIKFQSPQKFLDDMEDAFLDRRVAYFMLGEKKPHWIPENLDKRYGTTIGKDTYVFGTVILKEEKNNSSSAHEDDDEEDDNDDDEEEETEEETLKYLVEWDNPDICSTVLNVHVLLGGIFLASELEEKARKEEQITPLTMSSSVAFTKKTNEGFSLAPSVDIQNNADSTTAVTKRQSCEPVLMSAYLTQNNIHYNKKELIPYKRKIGLSYGGTFCQVCAFEERSRKWKSVVICLKHGVRCCQVVRRPDLGKEEEEPLEKILKTLGPDDWPSWLCPDRDATCWQKLHYFYIPKGLFGKDPSARWSDNGCPKTIGVAVNSQIYQDKGEWMFQHKLAEAGPFRRGRKRKPTDD